MGYFEETSVHVKMYLNRIKLEQNSLTISSIRLFPRHFFTNKMPQLEHNF